MQADDRDYHLQRAKAETERACQALSRPAADAHRRLSSLHMEALKNMDERRGGSNLG